MRKISQVASWRIRDERSWIDALFPRAGSVVDTKRNISELGKVWCGNLKEYLICWIAKIHGHTHGHQPKVVVWWDIRVSGYDSVQTDYWVINVSDKHKAIYILWCEHLESVSS